jgi:hypothetical protein
VKRQCLQMSLREANIESLIQKYNMEHNQISGKDIKTGGVAIQSMHPLSGNAMLGDNNVLCGRTRTYQNHVGNKRFRKMIQDNLRTYIDASRTDNSSVISSVIEEVRQRSVNGGSSRKNQCLECTVKSTISRRYVHLKELFGILSNS